MAIKTLWIKAIRQQDTALRVEGQQVLSTAELSGRRHHHPLAGLGPAAHPLDPGVSIDPACWRPLCDGLKHKQFRTMQVPKDGNGRGQACCRIGKGGEVMQMEQVGLLRSSLAPDLSRGSDEGPKGGMPHSSTDACR